VERRNKRLTVSLRHDNNRLKSCRLGLPELARDLDNPSRLIGGLDLPDSDPDPVLDSNFNFGMTSLHGDVWSVYQFYVYIISWEE
jgi:hypothetical protein